MLLRKSFRCWTVSKISYASGVNHNPNKQPCPVAGLDPFPSKLTLTGLQLPWFANAYVTATVQGLANKDSY